MITQEELKKQLHYNEETGIFTRLISNHHSVKIGDKAGSLDHDYWKIVVNKKQYYAHRLAWLYVYGEWSNFPESVIDHIDGNKQNNKIINLRKITHQENILNQKKRINNTSGVKGISWHKRSKNWQARVMINGASKYLGGFDNLEFAELVVMEARRKYHGEFARD